MLKLRPHHLLCIQKYTGIGYDPAFTSNMNRITEQLRTDPAIPVRLTEGMDQLCAACPNLQGATCLSEGKVRAMDEKVLAFCRFSYGDGGSWKDFAEMAARVFRSDAFEEICGSCQWADLCRNTQFPASR